MPPNDEITTAQACAILGDLDRSTISRWVQIGRLRPARRIGFGRNSAFLFRRVDVEALSAKLAEARSA